MTREEFRSRRKQLGLTRIKIAHELGIKPHHIAQFERGYGPPVTKWMTKAEAVLVKEASLQQGRLERLIGKSLESLLDTAPKVTLHLTADDIFVREQNQAAIKRSQSSKRTHRHQDLLWFREHPELRVLKKPANSSNSSLSSSSNCPNMGTDSKI